MTSPKTAGGSPERLTLDFHLLGEVRFDEIQALQNRLAIAAASGQARSVPVILCEHPRVITIGRLGSRAHIRLSDDQLKRQGVDVQWVSRGGGCIAHAPGQLCVYPILPLQEFGWSVGNYLQRFHRGVSQALDNVNVRVDSRGDTCGLWGNSGLLAAFGIQVRDGITRYGVYLNVSADKTLHGYVDTAVGENSGVQRTMSSLAAERRGAVSMARVRSAVIDALSESFQAGQHHIHAGHPWLATSEENRAGKSRRAV